MADSLTWSTLPICSTTKTSPKLSSPKAKEIHFPNFAPCSSGTSHFSAPCRKSFTVTAVKEFRAEATVLKFKTENSVYNAYLFSFATRFPSLLLEWILFDNCCFLTCSECLPVNRSVKTGWLAVNAFTYPRDALNIPATNKPGTPCKCPILDITYRGRSWSRAVITWNIRWIELCHQPPISITIIVRQCQVTVFTGLRFFLSFHSPWLWQLNILFYV